MQWSQLKRRLESLFTIKLNGRVAVHSTTYHQWNDATDAGRVWIAIDGHDVLNLCFNYALLYPVMPELMVRQLNQLGISSVPGDGSLADQREKLILSRRQVHQLIFDYVSLPIDDIISSEEPLVRGFGMLDRRVGKRRLVILREQKQHPWPRLLLGLRCEVEGL